MALPTILGLPLIPVAAVLLVIVFDIYKYIIQPAYLGPLSKIPNAHWSAPLSRLWILNERRLQRETFVVHAAHQKYGPVVRIAPAEISVNSVDGGLRTVYAGSFEKGDWYSNIFCNYGVRPMFAMEEHGPHSKRKRMLSNIYAKSTLQASPSIHAIIKIMIKDRLVPRLRNLSRQGKPVEMYTIFSAVTLDFVSAYVFGVKNGSDCTRDPELNAPFFRDYKARQKYGFWAQEMPLFTKLMAKIRLIEVIVPHWVNLANQAIEDMIMSMCNGAEQVYKESVTSGQEIPAQDMPTVYVHLRNALLKGTTDKGDSDQKVEQTRIANKLSVASEMLDHTLAGFDTSTIALAFLAWELSLPANSEWQDKLRHELAGLKGELDPKETDSLPILHAILMETLRLHASIPGNQPRVTPPAATIGPKGYTFTDLPANIRVQAQAWSLHRNADVYPDPETWNPGRWLDSDAETLKEMHRWFWAFGSGGRMCVGSNLAILDIKAIVAAVWSNFRTSIVYDAGMVHKGSYVAGPIGKDGKYLILDLKEDAVWQE